MSTACEKRRSRRLSCRARPEEIGARSEEVGARSEEIGDGGSVERKEGEWRESGGRVEGE